MKTLLLQPVFRLACWQIDINITSSQTVAVASDRNMSPGVVIHALEMYSQAYDPHAAILPRDPEPMRFIRNV